MHVIIIWDEVFYIDWVGNYFLKYRTLYFMGLSLWISEVVPQRRIGTKKKKKYNIEVIS